MSKGRRRVAWEVSVDVHGAVFLSCIAFGWSDVRNGETWPLHRRFGICVRNYLMTVGMKDYFAIYRYSPKTSSEPLISQITRPDARRERNRCVFLTL